MGNPTSLMLATKMIRSVIQSSRRTRLPLDCIQRKEFTSNIYESADGVDVLAQEQKDILREASALTLSLYRLCMRSVKLIRQGNEHDAKDFAEREEKQMQDMMSSSSRGTNSSNKEEADFAERLAGVVSMLPPVDPQGELQARSEYYAQYAHETFFSESDCLAIRRDDGQNRVDKDQFSRYFYHLRKGEEYRTWLLQDMKFENPFQFDFTRVDGLEARVDRFLREREQLDWQLMDPEEKHYLEQARKDLEEYDSEEEAFSEEEDDDDDEIPTNYRNKNRRFDDDDF